LVDTVFEQSKQSECIVKEKFCCKYFPPFMWVVVVVHHGLNVLSYG